MAIQSLQLQKKKNGIRILIPVDLQYLTLLVYHVHNFLSDFIESKKVIFKLQLAVDEIVTNIIKYGKHLGAEPHISISLVVNKQCIQLKVKDKAKAFNPLDYELPDIDAHKAKRKKGGLGIYLTRTVMDKIEYTYKKGNILTMKVFRKNSVSLL